MSKKFFIQTWGCQMNDHDGEKLTGLMLRDGYEEVKSSKEADIVLLNTCSIREKAVHKVFSELGRLKKEKLQRPLTIGITGCLAQQEQAHLFTRAPQIDFVLGTMALDKLPEVLTQAQINGEKSINVGDYPDNHLFPTEIAKRKPTAKALVTIIEGCNHACTYCIVPRTRGVERSRPFQSILDEVKRLVDEGYREIELLGQNVNSFQGGCNFTELLRKVSAVEGLEWLRFTTSHPMNFTKELAFEIVSNPKIAPFLHLPVQSGSNTVLKRMLREYTIEEYLERLAYLGSGRSQLCLSTDFIVGFPGESEQDFQKTLDLLDEVRFETSFSFIYSLRPGTSAVRLKDDLPAEVKQERLLRLQSRQAHWTLLDNQKMIGKIVNARIENPILNDQGFWIARTGSSKTVHLQGKAGRGPEMGQLITAQISGASPHFLAAELI
ncbi:MAG: hypothetical protein RLZZ438_823 [Acidobacteriota bacterium]|jgi:tRNA-2-methylthio-N6-dimethylallyladenosine synthase